jgi:SAM-dependent methyltransferase
MAVTKAPRRGVDHELRVGSLAHYEDPAYYASAYRTRAEDVAYYVALARAHGGPILEYGCGAGRLAIPMARTGAKVVGVDHSDAMLAALDAALAREPAEVRARVASKRGDMREVRLARRFPLVLATFNTFLHLYEREDVERFLARVRDHLSPDGRFVFDASLPSPIDLARDPGRPLRTPPLKHPTAGRCRYAERFDYDTARQILFVTMEFEPVAPDVEPFATPLAHRQFFPRELEALLHYNGFEVEKLEGGFRGEPLDRHADVGIWTCRPDAKWARANKRARGAR